MSFIAEIFSQGEEVVTGQIVDTNAAWLSEQLTELGFQVTRHTAVGDQMPALTSLIQEIAERADCCICTGGLGPTSDDLTTLAVNQATGIPLALDTTALMQIEQFFQRRHRTMPDVNRKQAYLPTGAIRIDNENGTAPGFALKFRRCQFVFLPGVPSEMQPMYRMHVKPLFLKLFHLKPKNLVSLRSIGIGESAIQAALTGLVLPDAVQLGFRATQDDVHTKLLFPAEFPGAEKQLIVTRIKEMIGDFVYAIDGLNAEPGELMTVLDALFSSKALNLAILETASQGLLAAKCAGRTWLQSAEICLNPRQVTEKTGVPFNTADLSACSKEVATALKKNHQTSLALAQLQATEDGPNQHQRIVIYNTLCAGDNMIFSNRHILAGTPGFNQNQAALLTLDLLRRYLQSH